MTELSAEDQMIARRADEEIASGQFASRMEELLREYTANPRAMAEIVHRECDALYTWWRARIKVMPFLNAEAHENLSMMNEIFSIVCDGEAQNEKADLSDPQRFESTAQGLRTIIDILRRRTLTQRGKKNLADTKRAGAADKRPLGIIAAIELRLRARPRRSARALWLSFPDDSKMEPGEEISVGGEEYIVYRDGDEKILQENHHAGGKPHSVGFDRFQKYVTEIRKKLKE